MERDEAIAEAGQVRLRPILIAFTTILAMLLMARLG